jgi:hypothetical protein
VHTINQGRTNYARLGLVVVDIFQNIFREIMRSNIAPEVLSIHIKKQHKNNPSVFNKMTHEERVSLKTLTNRTYDKIDFSLLYKLVRSFSILVDPTQGWGKQPKNADVTISDDVERLRIVRNKIVHRIKADINLIEMNENFSNIVNITQRIDTYLRKQSNQGFAREVLDFQTHCMDSEMEQKYYQALKDIEDMEGSKLLVFQVYLINLGRLSCPRLCRKKENSKSEDGHTTRKRKRTSYMFVFVCLMVFNATFNNISVISSWSSFIGGGNRSTRRKPLTCRKLLTNFIT